MEGSKRGEPIVFDAHGRHAQAVRFTADGRYLLSVGLDPRVRLWSVPDFRPVAAFEGHTKSVNTISMDREESRLATASSDGSVRLWSFPEGKSLHVFPGQVQGRLASDGKTLATVSAKGKVLLWDAKSGKEQATLPVSDKRLFGLLFSEDGKTLFVAGTGQIHRLRLPEGKPLPPLEGHKVAVACLCPSPDRKLLASTGGEGAIRLWSAASGEEVRRIDLRAGGVMQLAFGPKGDFVAVSVEGGIPLFGVKDGSPRGRIEVPVKGVYGIAISADGRRLANAAADGKVRVFELS